MQQHPLSAQTRHHLGTGAARAIRRENAIPAIVYGGKSPPRPIAIEPLPLAKLIETGRFNALVVALDIDGQTQELVVPRSVSFNRVTDAVEHVDFLRVKKTSQINVATPLHFINQHICQGLKLVGILNIVRHSVELRCTVSNIPEQVVVDLADYKMGDTIHISMITLPTGTTPVIQDRDFTVATITAPRGMQVADDTQAETTDETEED